MISKRHLSGGLWLLAMLCACVVRASISITPWVPIFKGVEFASGLADTNEVRLQRLVALRVDLTDPAVEFFSTPSNGSAPLETFGQTTTTFVQTSGVAAGINANFFSPVNTTPNDPRDLSGLAISQGNIVSAYEGGRPPVLITRSNHVTFPTSASANYSNIWTAVAGSDLVLVNGIAQLTNCTTDFCGPNPRSAVGLSRDQHYFYLVIIDGRQPNWSDGATLAETGQWLLRLGAWTALNLDGGGSSAMAKIESGTAVLLNRPSGGVQRVDGNHLGIFAPPIAPVVLTQPQSQNVLAGQNASFTVTAGGTTPLRYQWRLEGANLAGATTSSLTLANVQPANAGAYSVLLTNSAGMAASSNAVLTVTIPFEITNLLVTPRSSSAMISWRSDPQAVSQIEFGIASGYGSLSPLEASARTNHAILLVGLVPKTNYVFRILSRVGTNQLVSSQYNFSTDLNLIVDNPQALYSGVWTLSTSSPGQYGSSFQYAATTTDVNPSAQATYIPNILTPGQYDVFIWYPEGFNRSANTPVSFFYNTGYQSQTLDQRTGGGAWRLLAPALDFAAGTDGYAVLGNNTSETDKLVMADAFRWAYATSQDIPTDGKVPAWWSGYYFGTNVDASLDPDHDGYSTYMEYVMGTDPTNASSRFAAGVTRAGNGLQISFSPWQGGRTYQLQSAGNLVGPWTGLPDGASVTNGQGVFSISNSGAPGPRFYRVAVRLTP